MKQKSTPNRDMPIGKLTQVQDFLPPPKDLVFHEPMVKITISLNKSSVDFLKREAKKHHTPYQKMIRVLLDRYTQKYASPR